MTKKRDLDLLFVKKERAAGRTWQDLAGQLGWNVSALRDRCQRDGYREAASAMATEKPRQMVTEEDGIAIDWGQVESLLICGCTLEDVAATYGLNADYLAERYARAGLALKDIAVFILQCQARGRCQLRQSLFELAQSGDKQALSLVNEALK